MTKIIQTRVDANGDVHLDFSGFVGHDCQTEEDRLRRELASLGLNVGVKLSPKKVRQSICCHSTVRFNAEEYSVAFTSTMTYRMIAPCTVKDLMHKAICLLEASYFPERPDRFHPSAASIASPNLLALQRRELITLCKSPEKTSALLLANVVTRLALEKRTPTLLVTGKHSLTVLAVNLLLWRAGINLEEAVNPLGTRMSSRD